MDNLRYTDALTVVAHRWEDIEFPLTAKDEAVNRAIDSFDKNFNRLTVALWSPISLVHNARAFQMRVDQAYAEVWGLPLRRPNRSDPQYPRFIELLGDPADSAPVSILKLDSDELKAADPSLNQVNQLAASDEVHTGLTALLAGMVTGLWTAFEVFACDLWEAVLNARPCGLADLDGEWPGSTAMPKAKRPFRALSVPEDSRENSEKFVRRDYLRSYGYDLSNKMGTVLSDRFNFQKIDGIREAYIRAFNKSHSQIREAILHPAFVALAATRNALVHRAGMVDDKFVGDRNKCDHLKTLFPTATVGEPLKLTGPTVGQLVSEVVMQVVALVAAISEFVNSDGENK